MFWADPDPTFHFDAHPDPDPESLSQVRKSEISNASLLCFIYLISVIAVILFITLDSVLKFYGKKHSLSLHLVEMETDPDPFRQALDDDPAPDLAK